MTVDQIIEAWYSVEDEWFARRHLDKTCYEVVHNRGAEICDDTMTVLTTCDTREEANAKAQRYTDEARALAVLRSIGK